jgi:Protein of unknown function (DUF3489)
MFHEMSEAQRLVLRAAAARADRLLQPPTNARGAVARAIAGKLIGAGWAKEMMALNGAPIWRTDAASGMAFSLKLTGKGLKAVAGSSAESAGPAKASVTVGAEKTLPKRSSRQTEHLPALGTGVSNEDQQIEAAASAARAPRAGSKLGSVLDMLSAEAGATIAELMAATGWLEHSTQAALTGLRRRGYELSLTRRKRDGASVYRIEGRGGAAK